MKTNESMPITLLLSLAGILVWGQDQAPMQAVPPSSDIRSYKERLLQRRQQQQTETSDAQQAQLIKLAREAALKEIKRREQLADGTPPAAQPAPAQTVVTRPLPPGLSRLTGSSSTLTRLPPPPFALTSGGYSYVTNADGLAAITGFSGDCGSELIIPAKLEGRQVIEIGRSAFVNCGGLLRVSIPASVTNIDSGAFHNCENLVAFSVDPANSAYASTNGCLLDKCQATLIRCPPGKAGRCEVPASVRCVGAYAFLRCAKLTDIALPAGLVDIQEGAFAHCRQLFRLELPESVTNIGMCAFHRTGLVKIKIPQSVSAIGSQAFLSCSNLVELCLSSCVAQFEPAMIQGCVKLSDITVAPDNPAYTSIKGVLFDKRLRTLIRCPSGKTGECDIPRSVTCIGQNAFDGCGGVPQIKLPAGLADIQDTAFAHCSQLTQIDIPPGVTNIGQQAFLESALKTVALPRNLKVLSVWMFESCTNLTEVTIPANTREIHPFAFDGCLQLTAIVADPANPAVASQDGVLYDSAKTNIVVLPRGKRGTLKLPATVVQLKPGAFANSRLSSVILADGTTDVPPRTFDECADLTEVTLPNSVTVIGQEAFNGCGRLTSVAIPPGVVSIGNAAFRKTGLNRVDLPNGVGSVGLQAFKGCTNLTCVSVAASVTNLDAQAFLGCNSLTSITVAAANPLYSSRDGVLFNKDQTRIILVPQGKEGRYEIPPGVLSIESGRTFGLGFSVARPGTLTRSPLRRPTVVPFHGASRSDAFLSCSCLTEIAIPSSVTNLGESAFADCVSLTSLTVHAACPYYSSRDGVLYDKALSTLLFCPRGRTGTLAIPTGVSNISDYAFASCDRLGEVALPASLTNVGARAFFRCGGLTNAVIPVCLTNIVGWQAFAGCTNLPDSVQALGEGRHPPQAMTSLGVPLFRGLRRTPVSVNPYSFGTSTDGEAKLYGFNLKGQAGALAVTNELGGRPLTRIGDEAFKGCTNLTSVTLPSTVRTVAACAFDGCVKLVAIQVDSNNPSFCSDDGVLFSKDRTTLVACPNGKAGAYIIPGCVTNIADCAFMGCAYLTNIVFPDRDIRIGDCAFLKCARLPEDVRSRLYRFDYVVTNGYAVIGQPDASGTGSFKPAITPCPVGSLRFPSVLGGVPVATLGKGALASLGGRLSVVTIPASVTTIDGNLFETCNGLRSVYFEGNAPNIQTRSRQRYYLSRRTNVILPNSRPFGSAHTNVTVYVPAGSCGWDGQAGSANLPAQWLGMAIRHYTPEEKAANLQRLVPEIHKETVGGVEYSFVVVDGKAEILGNLRVMRGREGDGSECVFPVRAPAVSPDISGTLAIPSSLGGFPVTAIGEKAFQNNRMTSAIVPEGVQSLAREVFGYCQSMKSITLPDSLRSLGNACFEWSIQLETVRLPKNVETLGSGQYDDVSNLFEGCRRLASITVDKDNPHFTDVDGVLYDKPISRLIFCPASRRDLALAEGVSEVRRSLLVGRLDSLSIPSSTTNLIEDSWVYQGSPTLTVAGNNPAFTVVDGVLYDKGIGTLIRCPTIKSGAFTIPRSVTNIGRVAFAYCTNLTAVTIPPGVSEIGGQAFWNCSKLGKLMIPGNAQTLGWNAFGDCTNLTQLFFCGHAPLLNHNSLSDRTPATVYYLPGTEGWGKEFCGRPTAIWGSDEPIPPPTERPLPRKTNDPAQEPNAVLPSVLPLRRSAVPLSGQRRVVPVLPTSVGAAAPPAINPTSMPAKP